MQKEIRIFRSMVFVVDGVEFKFEEGEIYSFHQWYSWHASQGFVAVVCDRFGDVKLCPKDDFEFVKENVIKRIDIPARTYELINIVVNVGIPQDEVWIRNTAGDTLKYKVKV